jgi:ketosteroid isomerase-like protein
VTGARYGARVPDTRTDVDIARAFNDAINARDLDALTALMTDDHRFVDSEGASADGKAACTEAWRGFFAAFPDYRNVFDDVRSREPGVVDVAGRSECSVPELDGPARWRAVLRDQQIAVWQVFAQE